MFFVIFWKIRMFEVKLETNVEYDHRKENHVNTKHCIFVFLILDWIRRMDSENMLNDRLAL